MPSYPIDVRVDPNYAVAGTRRIKRELRDTRREASALQRTAAQLFGGATVALAVRRSVGLLADFSQSMSTVKAITRATNEEFIALRATAERLGRSTRFSATEAAEGMAFLARAGFDANEVLGTIEGTLNLAQAGGLGLADAADIASNALQGFRLEVDQTGRVVDVLALAANSSNTDVRQLGNAMSYVAPIAAGLGQDIEITTAAIGALSNAGIQGSAAGTGLRRVLTGLENPTGKARDVLQELGLTADQVSVSGVGLVESLQVLREAGITTAQALELFGDRGGPAFEVLVQSVDDVEEMANALDNAAGTAERIADVMDDNLNGAMLSAKSAMEGFVIAMGNAGAEDVLVGLFKTLAGLFRFAADNADILTIALVALTLRGVGGFTVALALNSTAIKGAIIGFKALQLSAGTTQAVLFALSAGTRALGASLLALATNPVVLGIAAIAAGYLVLKRGVVDLNEEIQETESMLSKFSSTASEIERDTALLKKRNEELASAIESTGVAAQTAATLEVAAISDRLKNNKALLETYRAQLVSQLALAKAANSQDEASFLFNNIGKGDAANAAMAKAFEADDENDFAKSEALFDEFERLAEIAIEERRKSVQTRALAGEIISKNDRKFLQAVTDRLENQHKILALEESIAAIDNPTKAVTTSGVGEGGGGGKIAKDFEAQFEALQELTTAIGLNRAAQERANGVKKFGEDIERRLTDKEKERVDAELRLQQIAKDNQAQKDRIEDIEQETSLLSMNAREAEIMAAIYEANRKSLLGLTPEQENRIRQLKEEQQAVRDGRIIQDRLDALNEESHALKFIGVEGKIATDVLRLQNQLERNLTDTEVEWLTNARKLNEEMQRRNAIMTAAKTPAQVAIDNMNTLVSLYRDGSITLREFNRELQNNTLLNQGRDLDRALNDNSAGLPPSKYEAMRQRAEALQREQEGGGVGDNPDEVFGISGQDLGVQDELDAIRDKMQEEIDLIREMQDKKLLNEQEFIDRKMAIIEQGELRQRQTLLTGLQMQVNTASDLFGSLTEVAAKTAGEQSGIYKAMFTAQKAFSIASATINIAKAISDAFAQGTTIYDKLAAAAVVAASTATIVSDIQSVRLKLASGGEVNGPGTRTSDSIPAMLSRDEFVVNAHDAQQNLGLLHDINNGNYRGYRNGGRVGGAPDGAFRRSPANDRSGGGLHITIGGIEVHVGGGKDAEEQGRRAGEAAGKAFVQSIISEETLPNGIIDRKFANG